jgi:hypothetical protein
MEVAITAVADKLLLQVVEIVEVAQDNFEYNSVILFFISKFATDLIPTLFSGKESIKGKSILDYFQILSPLSK